MSLTLNTHMETQKTKTTAAAAVIFMISKVPYVPFLRNHDGEIFMRYSKSLALVAILFLTIPAKHSRPYAWRRISSDNSIWACLGPLGRDAAGLRNYQSNTLVLSNAWRGLVPLMSTRADVERLLGSSKGSLAGSYAYETKEEKVRVVYSEGSCTPSLEGQWNAPVDTVLSVTVFPQTKVLVDSLRLDRRIFSRTQEAHPENWLYYVSAEKGVMVHAEQNNACEEVMSITYRPTTKDERLRCPNNAENPGKKP